MFLTSKIKSFNVCLLVILAILLTLIIPVNSSNKIDSSANTIVVLGDSLSAGYGVEIESSWPSLFEKSISNNNLNFQVVNAGISGDTTSGGLYRLPRLLSEHKPKIVILELGGNDGLRGMSLNKVVRKNLRAMIEMVNASGGIAVLVGVELPPNYGEMYTTSFKKIFVDLASEYNLVLINGSIKDMTERGLMQSDGIHPNQDGHQLIEQEVWLSLFPLLSKLSVS
jgi:acyl-CoA thioesterase-1